MLGGIIASLLLGFIPMFFFAWIVYRLDRYEKEPVHLLVVSFLWGAVVSSAAAFVINTLLGAGVYWLSGSENATNFATSSIIAPIVEEGFKGLAVLLIFLIFRNEFDSILDGIVYGAVTALGFAATENAYYIFTMGFQLSGWSGIMQLAFIRIVLVGWQHPFYTAFTGIGLASARMSKSTAVKVLAPVFGLFLAMLTHSIHNTLAPLLALNSGIQGLMRASQLDWLGWSFMLLFIIVMINREGKVLKLQLMKEVDYDIVTKTQYALLLSPSEMRKLKQNVINANSSEDIKALKILRQQGAELAHKKNQYLQFGEEQNNIEIIQDTRKKLRAASMQLRKYTEQSIQA